MTLRTTAAALALFTAGFAAPAMAQTTPDWTGPYVGVFIGGNTAVHQFCRIGEGAMLGGVTGITRNVIPFGFAFGPKADLVGLNVVGLKRRKFSRTDIHRIRSAYQALFFGGGNFAQRFEQVSTEYAGDPVIGKIVAFIREGGKRPLMMPADDAGGSDPDL